METTIRAQARAREQARAQEQAQENVNEHTYDREYAHERSDDGHPATRPQAYPIRGKVHRMKSALNGSAINVQGRVRSHVHGMKSERHFPCHNEDDRKYAPSYNLEDRQMQDDPYENGLSLWSGNGSGYGSGRGYGGDSNRSGYQYGIEVIHAKSYSRDGDDESAYPPPPFDPIFINDPLVPMRRPATAMPSAAKFDSMGAREHSAADADIDARNRPVNGRSTRAMAKRMEYNDNDELWDRGYAQQQQESISQWPDEGGPINDDNYDHEVAERARRWREIRKQTDALVFGKEKEMVATNSTNDPFKTEQRPKPRSQCLVYVAMTEEEKISLRNAEKMESERKLEVLGQKEEICAVCTMSVSSQPSDVSSVFVEGLEDIQGTPFNPQFQSIRTIKQRGGQVRAERDVRLLSFRNRCTCVCSCQQREELDAEGEVSNNKDGEINNEDGDISISSEEKEPGRFASTQHDPMTRSKIRGILLSPSAPVVKSQHSFVRRAKIDDKASSKKKTMEDRKSSPMRQRISNMRHATPSTSTVRSRKAYENRRKLSTHSPTVRKMRNASPRRQRLTERHVTDLHLHAASKGEEPTDDDGNASISPNSISGESQDLPSHGLKISEVEADISLTVPANSIKDDNIQQNQNPGKKKAIGPEITSNSIKDGNIQHNKKSRKKITPSQHISETRYGLSPLAPIVQIQNRDEEQQKLKASTNERKERFVTQRRQKISELKRDTSPTKPTNFNVPVIEILKSKLPHERRNQPKFLDNDILNGERAEKFMARRRKMTSTMKGGSPPTKEGDFSPPPLDVDEKDSFARRKIRRQKRQEQTAGRADDDDRD
eukprot:CAMPEP_0194075688 /NCGR_PEP_ID=MMETSP0149-20130528/2626_1 /TAXON_ID=122233 /ORGANISM="Chaetoceros debilis, Strain MM31A-1" /LENGTH=830 /DNA_ID=CAMNT_0038756231 /DNA_START=272 /DNA_END=2764 /DNA_ORIENTATION=-